MPKINKKQLLEKLQETLLNTVRRGMNAPSAGEAVRKAQMRYPDLPPDAMSRVLIKRATRLTVAEGVANGGGISACEAVIAAPAPPTGHRPAAVAGIIALLSADMAFTTKIQLQLVLEHGVLYGCPFDPENEEDVWLVFKAALGLKGTEKVAGYAQFIFNETARKQFRQLLRTGGARAAVQKLVTKVAGTRVAKLLSEKYLMRLIPLLNMAIAAGFNRHVTKGVGKWARVRAKTRACAFKPIDEIKASYPELRKWVLPIIFVVTTADNQLTDNGLTLYAQSADRLCLSETDREFVAKTNDSQDVEELLRQAMKQGNTDEERRLLLEIAINSAAIDLSANADTLQCVEKLALAWKVDLSPNAIPDRVNYLAS